MPKGLFPWWLSIPTNWRSRLTITTSQLTTPCQFDTQTHASIVNIPPLAAWSFIFIPWLWGPITIKLPQLVKFLVESLASWDWALEPTGKQEKTNSTNLASHLYMRTMEHIPCHPTAWACVPLNLHSLTWFYISLKAFKPVLWHRLCRFSIQLPLWFRKAVPSCLCTCSSYQILENLDTGNTNLRLMWKFECNWPQ